MMKMATLLCLPLLFGAQNGLKAQYVNADGGALSSVVPATNPILDGLLRSVSLPLTFRADDVISVRVYGVHDYDIQQRVDNNGEINFPLVGRVLVAGKSIKQLEAELSDKLSRSGMILEPVVTVTAASQPWAVVTVSGAVPKPGTFPAFGGLTVSDYLSQAGGLATGPVNAGSTQEPASSVVTLVRSSLSVPIDIPLGLKPQDSPYARIPLQPGDELRVARVGSVFAVGAFKNQGSYPLKTSAPTTGADLIAMAGGVGYEADSKNAYVIRIIDGKRTLIKIALGKILHNRDTDLVLQTNDILFVPTNQLKAAIKGGGASIVLSLATAYFYTH